MAKIITVTGFYRGEIIFPQGFFRGEEFTIEVEKIKDKLFNQHRELYINSDYITSLFEMESYKMSEHTFDIKFTVIERKGELSSICTFESIDEIIKKVNG